MNEPLSRLTSNPQMLTLALLGVFAFFFITSLLLAKFPLPASPPSTLNRFFLVCLRIAIGWHLAVEGADKLLSESWTSEGYLRESAGPLAPYFRDLAGDSAVEKLTARPGPLMPVRLDDEWNAYFEAFKTHYKLNADQVSRAQGNFDQSRKAYLDWMAMYKKPVDLPSSQPPAVKVDMSVEERIEQYKKLKKEVEKIEAELPKEGDKLWPALKTAKGYVSKARADLLADVNDQTKQMRDKLAEVLTDEQKLNPPLAKSVPTAMGTWGLLQWSDRIVAYGLLGAGLGLIIGLFTRVCALIGAGLLLMFFLAMIPMPYLPAPPNVEGHYIYINKNLIEFLALMVLATSRSGWWLGLDGLLRFLFPWNWRRNPA